MSQEEQGPICGTGEPVVKKARAPRAPKEAVKYGEDSDGTQLFKGPYSGIFKMTTTRNGTQRKVYYKELNPSSKSQKRKAESGSDSSAEPSPKKQKTSQ